MKHFLFRLLLAALIPLGTFAQKTITVPLPGDLADKAWVRSYVDSVAKAGIIVTPTDPPVTVKPCPSGPKIEQISQVSPASLELLFDASGVHRIAYEIRGPSGQPLFKSVTDSLTRNRLALPYNLLTDGTYTLAIEGYTCKSEKQDTRTFNVRTKPTGDNGTSDPPPVQPVNSTNLGAYISKIGGRTYTYNRTPELELRFNADGTISDVTAGLQQGKPAKLRGENVFYMIGYSVVTDSDGGYSGIQGMYLPDGVYTIRQFVCNPGKIPDLKAFIDGQTGWGDRGVNQINARLSEVFLSIVSDEKQGNNSVPRWLTVSRALNATKNLAAADWSPYNKTFSLGYINRGDAQSVYQRLGIQPFMILNGQPQADTWHTIKSNYLGRQSDDDLYNWGRGFMMGLGSDLRSVYTSELGENANGEDPDVYGRVQLHYKGALDVLKDKYGKVDVFKTGLFGDYGGDDFEGFYNSDLLYSSRDKYIQSLTDKIHKGYGVVPGGDFGFKNEDHQFYTRGHIDVRNLNHKVYFWNHLYNLPYQFIYNNERTKLGTKTWQGIDRERKMSIFTVAKVESFVMDNHGQKINIEQARTGEIIPFAGGEILAKMNTQPPVPWDEMYTTGLWGMLINGAVQIWDAPGSAFGSDSTKLHWWTDQPISWKPTGGDWQQYVSGQNGAPENSNTGLTHSLFASAVDACIAGMQKAYEIRDRTTTLSHASYTSSRGSFTATPGSAGFHLNGFGPVNWNSFTVRDAVEQKRGLAIFGEGKEGRVIIYYNGFLSPNNFEDVIVSYQGQQYKLGRVYGRQTIILKI